MTTLRVETCNAGGDCSSADLNWYRVLPLVQPTVVMGTDDGATVSASDGMVDSTGKVWLDIWLHVPMRHYNIMECRPNGGNWQLVVYGVPVGSPASTSAGSAASTCQFNPRVGANQVDVRVRDLDFNREVSRTIRFTYVGGDTTEPTLPAPPAQPARTPEPPKACQHPALAQPTARQVKAGDMVTLAGSDLGVTGTIAVGGKPAQVVAWTGNAVQFEVPADLDGTVNVVANCGSPSNPVQLEVVNLPPNASGAAIPEKTRKGRYTDLFVLDSRMSSDPDGTVVRAEWRDHHTKKLISTKRVLRKRFAYKNLRNGHRKVYLLDLKVWDDKGATNRTVVRVIPRKPPVLKVVLRTAYFGNDLSRLSKSERAAVRRLRKYLRGSEELLIQAYASKPASKLYNHRLTAKRARTVRHELLTKLPRKSRAAKVIMRCYGEHFARQASRSRQWLDRKVVVTIRYTKVKRGKEPRYSRCV